MQGHILSSGDALWEKSLFLGKRRLSFRNADRSISLSHTHTHTIYSGQLSGSYVNRGQLVGCVGGQKKQGVCHTAALPFILRSILWQKKNYGNKNISPCKNIIVKKILQMKRKSFKIS
jgi:hypothetical protein